MTTKEINLLSAEQQLTGFSYGKIDPRVISLVEGMALTKSEWEALKKQKRVDFMLQSDIDAINEYFD